MQEARLYLGGETMQRGGDSETTWEEKCPTILVSQLSLAPNQLAHGITATD